MLELPEVGLGCDVNLPLSVPEGLRDGLGLGLGYAAAIELLDEGCKR